jgi:hypothetical protein
MSRCLAAALVGCFLISLGSSIRADDPNDMKALIAKALKAHGGAEKLQKFPAVHLKVKGMDHSMGQNSPYTGEYWIQGGKQFRYVIQEEIDGEVATEIQVLNGDKGWIVEDGETTEMDKDVLAEAKEDMYLQWVTGLTPLLDKEFKFDWLGKMKIGAKQAVGVRVIRKGHRDINLYFDVENGLLLKSEMRVIGVDDDGREVTQESFYEEYKEAEGIMYPAKVTIKRDGVDYNVEEVTEYKLEEKLDENLFEKPKIEKQGYSSALVGDVKSAQEVLPNHAR